MNLAQFVYEGLKMAFKAIGSYRLRAFLTMLGVGTAIFVITSILTMVNSMRTSVTENLSEMGNTTLFVHNWPWKDNSADWFKYINRPRVSYQEYQRLKQGLDGIEGVSFTVSTNAKSAKAKGRSVSNINVQGITEDEGLLTDFEFAAGRFLSENEFRNGSSVCVIGHDIAENLFPDTEPLNKTLRLGSKQLKIIGVLERTGEGFFDNQDESLYIPYKLAPRIFNLRQRFADKVIAIKISNPDDRDYVEDEVIGIMRAARNLKPKEENNFAINKPESIINAIDNVFKYLEYGGWVISIFSILIGGFSIGNIMYISVRERTKEIGVQKALGSTRGFILFQFLAEALLICLMGGLLGLVCVFGLAELAQLLIQQTGVSMNIFVSSGNISMALGLSLAIGLLSGFIPALIASSVDPVVAIRRG